MIKSFCVHFKGNGIEIVDGVFQADIQGHITREQLKRYYLEHHTPPCVAAKIRESGKKIVFTEIQGHC